MRSGLFRALATALALFACSVAHAAGSPKAEAKAHYMSGTKHYALSEFAEALTEFKEAYRIHPDPVFLFNIAQCHRRLNDPAKASEFYKSYLREAPNAPNRVDVERIITEIDTQQEAERAKRAEAERAAAAEAAQKAEQARATETHADAALTSRPPEKKPLVKKAWFWGAIVGGAAVVATAVTLGVVFGVKKDPVPTNGTVGVQ